MSTTLTWDGVLADLAQRVELAELALDEGIDLDPRLLMPWTPPEGLGPLPERLRDQAVGVLAAQADLEKRLNFAMEQISREIGSTNQGRKLSPSAKPSYPSTSIALFSSYRKRCPRRAELGFIVCWGRKAHSPLPSGLHSQLPRIVTIRQQFVRKLVKKSVMTAEH